MSNILKFLVDRVEKKYACCPVNYTMLHYDVVIQRKPLYYVLNLIAATAVITFISIIGFFTSVNPFTNFCNVCVWILTPMFLSLFVQMSRVRPFISFPLVNPMVLETTNLCCFAYRLTFLFIFSLEKFQANLSINFQIILCARSSPRENHFGYHYTAINVDYDFHGF